MKTDSYLQAAFFEVCSNAKQPKGYYVSLMERRPFYGGREEGGWWGQDEILCAYQYFDTEEAAITAKEAVEQMAKELQQESKREFGQYCLDTMEWLDERGLDADYLPEPDGPSEFYVAMTEELPENHYGNRVYE